MEHNSVVTLPRNKCTKINAGQSCERELLRRPLFGMRLLPSTVPQFASAVSIAIVEVNSNSMQRLTAHCPHISITIYQVLFHYILLSTSIICGHFSHVDHFPAEQTRCQKCRIECIAMHLLSIYVLMTYLHAAHRLRVQTRPFQPFNSFIDCFRRLSPRNQSGFSGVRVKFGQGHRFTIPHRIDCKLETISSYRE